MSVFLITSSFVDHAAHPARGVRGRAAQANGRALAYLAHEYLGDGFGTVYDLSTIADPLVRRRLGHGRAAQHRPPVPAPLRDGAGVDPGGAAAGADLHGHRRSPITVLFRADVDAQAGAYATGVLVLMTSAAVAVTLSARRARPARGGCSPSA